MVTLGPVVSEKMSFEMCTGVRRENDARRTTRGGGGGGGGGVMDLFTKSSRERRHENLNNNSLNWSTTKGKKRGLEITKA